MVNITRSGFLKRASAVAGAIAAYAALGPRPSALAASECNPVQYEIQKSTTCRVQYSAPSCSGTQPLTVYSPNDRYVLTSCGFGCDNPCHCNPTYVQARGACCNDGRCSCSPRFSN